MEVGSVTHGFKVTNVRELKESDGVLYEMEYLKNGAKLCFFQRDDNNKAFSIAFKTIPEDSTGVFHIIEHSVMAGSRKYPACFCRIFQKSGFLFHRGSPFRFLPPSHIPHSSEAHPAFPTFLSSGGSVCPAFQAPSEPEQ